MEISCWWTHSRHYNCSGFCARSRLKQQTWLVIFEELAKQNYRLRSPLCRKNYIPWNLLVNTQSHTFLDASYRSFLEASPLYTCETIALTFKRFFFFLSHNEQFFIKVSEANKMYGKSFSKRIAVMFFNNINHIRNDKTYLLGMFFIISVVRVSSPSKILFKSSW